MNGLKISFEKRVSAKLEKELRIIGVEISQEFQDLAHDYGIYKGVRVLSGDPILKVGELNAGWVVEVEPHMVIALGDFPEFEEKLLDFLAALSVYEEKKQAALATWQGEVTHSYF